VELGGIRFGKNDLILKFWEYKMTLSINLNGSYHLQNNEAAVALAENGFEHEVEMIEVYTLKINT